MSTTPRQGPLGPAQSVMLTVTPTPFLGVRHALRHDASYHCPLPRWIAAAATPVRMRAHQAGGATATVSAAVRWRCQGDAARPPATPDEAYDKASLRSSRRTPRTPAGSSRARVSFSGWCGGRARLADAATLCAGVPGDAGGGAGGEASRGLRVCPAFSSASKFGG
jgi:hypothetical protein